MTYVPNNQKCNTCEHNFGKHYSSNDDTQTGCSTAGCQCHGFTMVVKAEKPSYRSSGNYWEDR